MAIKVYGSNTCPGTLRFLNTLTSHHYMPVFVNVTGSVGLLKEFIKLRDTLPIYKDIIGSGSIGFPLIELEDGTFTMDCEKVLKDLGITDTEFKFTNE